MQVECLNEPFEIPGVVFGEVGPGFRFIRKPESDVVDGQAAVRVAEPLDQMAVEERPSGVAVDQYQRFPLALIEVVHPSALQGEKVRAKWVLIGVDPTIVSSAAHPSVLSRFCVPLGGDQGAARATMRAKGVDCYRLIRPALFMLPPEPAHQVVRSLLRVTAATPVCPLLAARYTVSDARLRSKVFGVTFPNPVGVAAGFDKNGELPRALACLGFGHIEIGAVTAEAQPGNPPPRLFRLDQDRALINRLGFDSQGADRVSRRLRRTHRAGIPVGINIGKSRVAPLSAAEQDYPTGPPRTAADP